MKRAVSVDMSEFSIEALSGWGDDDAGSEHVPARLLRALRFYLKGRGEGRPGWAYPDFQREHGGGKVALELAVDEDLWRAFEREARRQGVTVSRMAEHAVFLYAAEVDAGNITQRILDDLGVEETWTSRGRMGP